LEDNDESHILDKGSNKLYTISVTELLN